MHALISAVTTNKTEFTTSKQEGIKIGERTQSIQKRKDNQKQRRRDGNRG